MLYKLLLELQIPENSYDTMISNLKEHGLEIFFYVMEETSYVTKDTSKICKKHQRKNKEETY